MNMQGKRQDPFYQALNVLSRRNHSVFEVKAKLRRKGFNPQQIDRVVSQLKTQGLLDDRTFAVIFTDSTLRAKSVGPRWLKAKLRQKGIAATLVDEVISAKFPPGAEEKLARRAADTWRRSHPRHAHDSTRLMRFLASRGFSQSAYAFFDRRMSGK